MGIVRPITRPVTRPVVSYPTRMSDEARIAANALVVPDYSDLTSLYMGRDGSGGHPNPGDPFGLVLNKSGMGGKTAAEYIARRPNLAPGTITTTGTGWTDNGDGSYTHAPGVASELRFLSGDGLLIEGQKCVVSFDITFNGGNALSVIVGGTEVSLNRFTTSSTGPTTGVVNAENVAFDSVRFAAGVTTDATISNIFIKHIPNEHITAPADNQRPVLDLTNGVYSPNYDGVDDGLQFNFPGGAGPSDCSIFIVPNRLDTNNGGFFSRVSGGGFIGAMDGSTITDHHTGAGAITTFVDSQQLADERRNTLKTAIGTNQKRLVEFRNADLSAWPDMMIADIFSAPYEFEGQLIGPIIVETSKLTNSLRRTIETYLKRKAGIL